MTQALLNNLNIIEKSEYGYNDTHLSKIDHNQFDKIFNTDNIKNYETVSNKCISGINANIHDRNNELELKQENYVNCSTFCNEDNDTFSIELKTAVQESIAETVVEIAPLDSTDCFYSINNDIETHENNDEKNTVNISDTNNEILTNLICSQVSTTTYKTSEPDNENQAYQNSNDIKEKVILNENLTDTDLGLSLENNEIIQEEVNVTISKQNDILEEDTQNKIDKEIAEDLKLESLEFENDSSQDSNSSDLMQKQTPQEQAVKAMLQGDIKNDKVFSDIITNTTNNDNSTDITPSKIIEQIAKQMDKLNHTSKVNIVLNPESLGKIHLQLINSKEGLTAQFLVTTPETKSLLMNGLEGLKDNLLAHGVNIDNVSVKLEEITESENPSDWTEQEGSRGGNKQQGSQKQKKDDEKPFEQMMFELNKNDKV